MGSGTFRGTRDPMYTPVGLNTPEGGMGSGTNCLGRNKMRQNQVLTPRRVGWVPGPHLPSPTNPGMGCLNTPEGGMGSGTGCG